MADVEDVEGRDIVSRDKSWLAVKVRIGMGRVRMIQIESQEVNDANSHGVRFYLYHLKRKVDHIQRGSNMSQQQKPFVQPGEPLPEFLPSFWRRQIDAAEQETPDYRHPPLPLARIKKVMKSDPEVKVHPCRSALDLSALTSSGR